MSDLTAILLCGGKGERLRPFTDTLPKALVPLNGQPLLYHLLKYLSVAGVKRFVLCVGYKAELIEQYLKEHRDPAWDITCVDSGDASMTKRLLDARAHVSGPALICYGDTLANVDLSALHKEHEASGALMTMTVYPLHSPFGIVGFNGTKRVTEFMEKPRLPYWINIGFMLCQPEALGFIGPHSDMPDFLSALAEAGALSVHQHEGKHLTVNTEKERAAAEAEIAVIFEFFTLMDEQKI